MLQRSGGVLYVDKQSCNLGDYKLCIHLMKKHFLASEVAIRYRLVNLGWMKFNMTFDRQEDPGISIAKYLEKHNR